MYGLSCRTSSVSIHGCYVTLFDLSNLHICAGEHWNILTAVPEIRTWQAGISSFFHRKCIWSFGLNKLFFSPQRLEFSTFFCVSLWNSWFCSGVVATTMQSSRKNVFCCELVCLTDQSSAHKHSCVCTSESARVCVSNSCFHPFMSCLLCLCFGKRSKESL